MKKIYTLCCVFAFASTIAVAQFASGQKVLGGNLGFSIGKSDYPISYPSNSRYTNFSVNPSFGKFKKPNVLQGVSLSYSFRHEKNDNALNNTSNKSNTHSFGIDFYRQRFFPLVHNLYFTVEGSFGGSYNFGRSTYSSPGQSSETKNNGFGVGVGVSPGLTYQLSKRVLFDAALSNLFFATFSHSTAKSAGTTAKSDSFSLSSSLSNTNLGNVGLGFRWLLKK